MADATEEWSTPSNEAITISVTRTNDEGVKPLAHFHPKFTYAIFDEQQIFGYQGLKVNLRYDAADLRPNVKITHNKVFEAIGDTEPTDIKAALEPYLPPVAFQSEREFAAATMDLSDNDEQWKPPGELIRTIPNDEGPYEIYKGTLADPAIRQLVKRIEIMVLFYIEGGSTIVDDDLPDYENERWDVFLLYQKKWLTEEKDVGRYTFQGYCTAYRFHMIDRDSLQTTPVTPKDDLDMPDDFTIASLSCRMRISQFLILPPYLHKGNGARLYRTVFDTFLAMDNCKEITVEDPNEAFDDLRDTVDLKFLRTLPELGAIKMNLDYQPDLNKQKDPFPIIDPKAIRALKKKTKIVSRQLLRLIEMHLMSQLPDSVRPFIPAKDDAPRPKPTAEDKKTYKMFKQVMKVRLYRHNMDLLKDLEKSDRIEKVDSAQKSVELEYVRLLSLCKDRAAIAETKPNGATATNGGAVVAVKREESKKRALEEDDDGESSEEETKHKKAKLVAL